MPSDTAIIEACNNAPQGKCTRTKSIILLSPELVVKHINITLEGCRNQIKAHKLLDSSVVVVPKVYRCFSHNGNIYLIMQRIHGEVKDKIEDVQSVKRVADFIRHLQTHKSSIPGPLEGGISRGLWWENEHVDLKGEVASLCLALCQRYDTQV